MVDKLKQQIVAMVRNFDTDPAVKVEFLGNLYARDGERLDAEEVLARWGKWRLYHFASPISSRERCYGLLGHMYTLRDVLTGRVAPIMGCEHCRDASWRDIATLQTEWKDHPRLHGPVDAFQLALECAAEQFDIQMAVVWMSLIDPELLAGMDLCKGRDVREVLGALAQVGRPASQAGCMLLETEVKEARTEIEQQLTPGVLSSVILLPRESEIAIAQERMSLYATQSRENALPAVS